jgi:membrane protein YqaA with SNARE-associated domain
MKMLFEPWAWLLVVLISALGLAVNLTNYYLGKRGFDAVQSRFPRIKPEHWARARDLYERRGPWILILTAVPLLGLVLTTAAGTFGIRRGEFVLWVGAGKLARNWLILLILVEGYRLAGA